MRVAALDDDMVSPSTIQPSRSYGLPDDLRQDRPSESNSRSYGLPSESDDDQDEVVSHQYQSFAVGLPYKISSHAKAFKLISPPAQASDVLRRQSLRQKLLVINQQHSLQERELDKRLADEQASAKNAQEAERQRTATALQAEMMGLQQSHRAASAAHQQQVEERRRAVEQERRRLQQEAENKRKEEEQEARRKREAEEAEQHRRQQVAAAAAAAEAVRSQQERDKAAAQQRTSEAAKAPSAAGAAPAGNGTAQTTNGVCVSPAAAEWSAALAARLAEAEALSAPLAADPSFKTQRRALEKDITKFVQQISATQMQVDAKSRDLVGVLQRCGEGAARCFACCVLARKLLLQCEAQVVKQQRFAFPLAAVALRVAVALPQFMDLLLALLHKACPLSVPAYPLHRKGSPTDEYLRSLGYRDVDAAEGGQRLELPDEFVDRMQGYVLFYAALVQSEYPGHPHGLPHAWAYVARLLNHLPANRFTATALIAFLKVAGYAMCRQYGRQFAKLAAYIAKYFVGALQRAGAADATAATTRLQLYLTSQAYHKEPEGRALPRVDSSSNSENRA